MVSWNLFDSIDRNVLMSLKYGMGGWSKTDILCLMLAVLGIILWKITDNPALGLYAAVTADFAGMIPALVKTYKNPATEHYLAYAFDLTAILLTGLAIRNGGFNEYLYPVYLFLINGLMMIFLLRDKPVSS